MIKLAVYGLSGCGKSTVARIIADYFSAGKKTIEFIKLAYPLYKIQQVYYETAGGKIDFYEQDQLLLESIAANLRRISSLSLVNDFMERLKKSEADVVINDDIRDYQTDYPALKKEGFIFVKVHCDEELRVRRLKARKDISITIVSQTTRDIDKFSADCAIDTGFEDQDHVKTHIHRFLQRFIDRP